jgi:hypothetical protein
MVGNLFPTTNGPLSPAIITYQQRPHIHAFHTYFFLLESQFMLSILFPGDLGSPSSRTPLKWHREMKRRGLARRPLWTFSLPLTRNSTTFQDAKAPSLLCRTPSGADAGEPMPSSTTARRRFPGFLSRAGQ